MKILKSLILFAAVNAMLLSCSKKESIQVCNKMTSEGNIGGPAPTTFSYTNNKLTSIVNATGHNEFIYDSEGRLTTETFTYTSTGEQFVYNYSYDSSNHIAQWVQTGIAKTIWTYNSTGQVVKVENYYYSNVASSYMINIYSEYSYPNSTTHNYSAYTTYDSNSNVQVTCTFKWDNKHNPTADVYSQYTGIVQPDSNVTQITQTPGEPPVWNFSYTYNSSGYPLAKTLITTEQPNQVTTYTYSCN